MVRSLNTKWLLNPFTALCFLLPGQLNAKDLTDNREYHVANAIHQVLQATRKTYTAKVSDKLFKDGTGSLLDYKSHKGFVPLPLQIAQSIAKEVHRKTDGNISIEFKSRYFVNEENRLIGKENAAWDFLFQQQQEAEDVRKINWQPFSYLEEQQQGNQLVYIAPDLASDQSCISCHTAQEHINAVSHKRKRHNVEDKPILKLWHMIGLVKITVKVQ